MVGAGGLYPSEKAVAERIIAACRRLHGAGMLAAADGNVSVRLEGNRIVMTPSGASKADLKIEEFTIVSQEGFVHTGNPSSELAMHLTVYRQVADAGAVIHAHGPHAVAWTIARPDLTELPAAALAEVIPCCGSLPIVPYATPGSDELAQEVAKYLPEHRVMIMARHGIISWGENLEEAMRGCERVEHVAKTLWLAAQVGEVTELDGAEVEKLRRLRAKIGKRTL